MAECDLQAAIDARKKEQLDFRPAVIPSGYQVILRKCLAFRTEQRYASAQELFEDLDAQLHHRPLVHARESLGSRLSKLRHRYPRAFSASMISAVAITVCCLMAVLTITTWRRTERLTAINNLNAYLEQLQGELNPVIDLTAGEDLPPTIGALSQLKPGTQQLFSSDWLSAEQLANAARAEFDACLVSAWLLYEKDPVGSSSNVALGSLLEACQRYPAHAKSSGLLRELVRLTKSQPLAEPAIQSNALKQAKDLPGANLSWQRVAG